MLPLDLDSSTHLRMLTPLDAPALFAAIDQDRAHISKHDLWPIRVTDERGALGMIERHQTAYDQGIGMFPGIFVDGEIGGMCGVRDVDTLHGVGTCSYWLAARCTGRGIITRALTLLADEWLLRRGLLKLEITCDEANLPSAAVARRLGFTLEGKPRGSPSNPIKLAPALYFGLLQEEWAATRDAKLILSPKA